jgi:O-acetyl-ADP-ribose deacetylase (regulator of RNase III)
MIHEVTGDITLSKAQAVAHGVAPGDHFDRGLALALREMWPAMAKDFRHYSHQCHPKPGELWVWGGTGGARVIALLTQGEHGHGGHPGPATDAAVNHCLKRLRYELEKAEIKSVALPKLATGVGGMKWETVRSLIEHHLGDLPIPVYVYSTYHPGVRAVEPGA